MGYTHYWRFQGTPDKKKMDAGIAACNKVVGKAKVPLANGFGEGEPELRKGKCCFNGRGPDDDHETFMVETGDTGFQFCKTAFKPYDPVVVACLIALKHTLGGSVTVSSDGRQEDWAEGMELCQEVLGYGGDFKLEVG